MRQRLSIDHPDAADGRRSAPEEPDSTLIVTMVYQDALTRQWATELWSRVGRLTDHGGIRCKAWCVNELAQDEEFSTAVQAAAKADVLVISIRDTGELPLFLHVWIDAWMPRRAGREGALVAILGIPPEPDAFSGGTRHYLQAVARRVGLDYLPQERTLTERPQIASSSVRLTPRRSSSRPASRRPSPLHPVRRGRE